MTPSTLCRQILSEPELIARELARMDELEAAWLAGQKVYSDMDHWRTAREAGPVPAGEEPLLQRHADVILRRRAWRASRLV